MGKDRNFAALEWVVKEISETLADARQALESYVNDPKDSSRIRFCLSYIHQVHGSLQMVEFHGASMLAREMETLATGILNQNLANQQEAIEVLMRAVLQLPLYLDHVIATREDQPTVVLPLLNDIRAACRETYLTESNIFSPDLSSLEQLRGKRHPVTLDAAKLRPLLQKLREMYQFAAASSLRNIKVEENLSYLDKVCLRLETMTRGYACYPLWEATEAMVHALSKGTIDLSVAVKGLLRSLAAELRMLTEKAPDSLHNGPSLGLLKNILYYLAISEDDSAKVLSLRERYGLDAALKDGGDRSVNGGAGLMATPDSEAIRSVISALFEELNAIKHSLNTAMSGVASPSDFEDILPIIKRVSDTLAVLGVGELRQQVMEQNAAVEAMYHSNAFDETKLMDVASGFIEVEHRLESISRAAGSNRDLNDIDQREIEIDEAKLAVLNECQRGLEKAKSAIVEYISSNWDKTHLGNIDELLNEIRGGLDMIPLVRPAMIVSACSRYIHEQIIDNEQRPDWKSLDQLADAVASLEYYIENMASEARLEDDSLLDIAEQSMLALGYGLYGDEDDAEDPGQKSLVQEPRVEEKPAGTEDAAGVEAVSEQPAIVQPDDTLPVLDNDEREEIGLVVDHGFDNAPVAEAEDQMIDPSTEAAAISSVHEASEDSDEDEIDGEILEIFIEEAGEVLATLHEYFPKWQAQPQDEESLTIVRRAFHTLKGSGRMVRAEDLGELAWSVENMLNRVIDNSVRLNPSHYKLIELVMAIVPGMVSAFEARRSYAQLDKVLQYRAWAENLAEGTEPDDLVQMDLSSEPQAEHAEDAASDLDLEDDEDAVLLDIFASETTVHLGTVKEFIEQAEREAPIYSPPSDELQRALHTIKGSAKMAGIGPIAEMAAALEGFAKELISYQVSVDDDILQLFKDMVSYTYEGLACIGERRPVEVAKLSQFLARNAELFENAVGHLIRMKESEKDGSHVVDPKLLSLFMAEEMNLLLDAEESLQAWQQNPDNVAPLYDLNNELVKLERGAREANLPDMANLSELLQKVYQRIFDGQRACSEATLTGLVTGHEGLLDLVDAIAAGQNPAPPPEEIVKTVESLLTNDDALENPIAEPITVQHVELQEPVTEAAAFTPATQTQPDSARVPGLLDDISLDDEEFDQDILEVYLEEAEELVENIDEAVHEWERDPGQTEPGEEIKRSLHTMKGGARLSRMLKLGDLSHDFETFLIDNDREEHDDSFFVRVYQYQDKMQSAVAAIRRALALSDSVKADPAAVAQLSGVQAPLDDEPAARSAAPGQDQYLSTDANDSGWQDKQALTNELAAEDTTISSQLDESEERNRVNEFGFDAAQQQTFPPSEPEVTVEIAAEFQPEVIPETQPGPPPVTDNVVPFAPKPAGELMPAVPPGSIDHKKTLAEATAMLGGISASARGSGQQEAVKIPAELLEELVNLAGETSISRSRLEQQVSDFSGSLSEIDATLSRLHDQLRRLDLETEAQIMFRREQLADDESFDPLEMDRYSHLQQLSRSLAESASDLVDLRSDLGEKLKDTETLLIQQSRVNTDLQEGLMRSRMVPFSRLAPRLRRVVRQVAVEINKNVNFEMDNIEGELDRSMLERMLPPLEHMLRNAVDHGIESPEERISAGKPEAGRIVLSLAREGSEVILRLADDGRGINIARVKQKAIERGLMSADADLTDHDIMQFIFEAGFSTVDSVTQISGRGVGMDVVYAEIKQLSGSVSIDSRPGQGTQFTVRLPFTVSVNRALMVDVANEQYAVPLNSIQGIVRINPFELEHYYSDPDARFEYAGESYNIRYLGSMLSGDIKPNLDGHVLPLPIILVRSADHAIAIQVDALRGSREIVVKNLGAQFSLVQGVAGATVMGDGSVVVILDSHALVRKDLAHAGAQVVQFDQTALLPEAEDGNLKTIMVVDDSVTVRKVTSRFLEREGFNVITANDGVDALQVLQDTIPDLMLLDIEMPRMDGFEVAKNIRGTSRWKHIPIIMITSRTGQKHRDRATELGVDRYMGKPYQEEALLSAMQELLKRKKKPRY